VSHYFIYQNFPTFVCLILYTYICVHFRVSTYGRVPTALFPQRANSKTGILKKIFFLPCYIYIQGVYIVCFFFVVANQSLVYGTRVFNTITPGVLPLFISLVGGCRVCDTTYDHCVCVPCFIPSLNVCGCVTYDQINREHTRLFSGKWVCLCFIPLPFGRDFFLSHVLSHLLY